MAMLEAIKLFPVPPLPPPTVQISGTGTWTVPFRDDFYLSSIRFNVDIDKI
jgi:hypothetical protein